MARKKLLCLDAGHFHPTGPSLTRSPRSYRSSTILLHQPRRALGQRPRGDLNDDLRAIAELVRGDYLGRVHIGLDFFDASINRVAAWVIGTRSMIKALLLAMLEPIDQLRKLECSGDFTGRLAMVEELKTLPFKRPWDYYCAKQGVPVGPLARRGAVRSGGDEQR